MRWFTPFHLGSEVLVDLKQELGEAWAETGGLDEGPRDLICFYLPPHIAINFHEHDELSLIYERMQVTPPYIRVWNLERLMIHPKKYWLDILMGHIEPLDFRQSALPEVDPLLAVIAYHLVSEKPRILDIYLDLELRTPLFGPGSDSHYVIRLKNQCTSTRLLCSLKEIMKNESTNLNEINRMSSVIDINDSQIQHILVEMDRIAKANDEIDMEMVALRNVVTRQNEELEIQSLEIQRLRQKLEIELKNNNHLEAKLDSLSCDLSATQQGKDLLDDQLNHTQNELERHFHLIRESSIHAEAQWNVVTRQNEELEIQSSEILRLREQLEIELQNTNHLESKFDSLSCDLSATQQGKDLLDDQLNHTQNELERHFHLNMESSILVEAQWKELRRVLNIIERLLALKDTGYIDNNRSIQVMALLEAYRHSLKRAARLLGSG